MTSSTGLRKGDSTVTLSSRRSFSAMAFLAKSTLISCLERSKALLSVLTPMVSRSISLSQYQTLAMVSTTVMESFLSPQTVSSMSQWLNLQEMLGLAVYISRCLTKNYSSKRAKVRIIIWEVVLSCTDERLQIFLKIEVIFGLYSQVIKQQRSEIIQHPTFRASVRDLSNNLLTRLGRIPSDRIRINCLTINFIICNFIFLQSAQAYQAFIYSTCAVLHLKHFTLSIKVKDIFLLSRLKWFWALNGCQLRQLRRWWI